MKYKLNESKNWNGKTYECYKYGNWINSLFVERYNEVGKIHYPSFSKYAKSCIFKLDLTFDQHRLKRRKADLGVAENSYDIEHDNFLFVYRWIVHKLYGKKFSRAHYVAKSPLVISCIDFQGSRFANSKTLSNWNAHIHSVWAVRPEDRSAFLAIVDDFRFRLRLVNQLDVDCDVRFERFNPALGSVENLVSYAVKSHTKSTATGLGDDLLRIYPNANFSPSGQTYRASGSYPVMLRSVDRMNAAIASQAAEQEPWERSPAKLRTDDVMEFLDRETLVCVDLECANDLLATLNGTNSGPYRMKKSEGAEPTVVQGATGNHLLIRSEAKMQELRSAVSELAASLEAEKSDESEEKITPNVGAVSLSG